MSAPAKCSARIVGLDLLRALAVGLVLMRHAPALPADTAAIFRVPLSLLAQVGWVGVDLFFALSGFLVGGLLLAEQQRTGTVALDRFLARRALKLYPAFYAMLAATLFMHLAGWITGPRFSDYLGEALFLQNYLGATWNHTWSLAVEEHFYLGLAVVIALLARRNRLDLIPPIVVGLFVACLALRLVTWFSHPDWAFHVHIAPTHLRIDALAAGVLLAYLWHRFPTPTRAFFLAHRWPLTIASLATLSITLVWPIESRWVATIGLSFTLIGSTLLTGLAATAIIDTRGRAVRAIRGIGVHSYSIYLWHAPVEYMLLQSTKPWLTSGPRMLAMTGIYLVASIVVGIVLARLIEWPMLRLRDRLVPSNRTTTTSAPADRSPVCDPSGTGLAAPAAG